MPDLVRDWQSVDSAEMKFSQKCLFIFLDTYVTFPIALLVPVPGYFGESPLASYITF